MKADSKKRPLVVSVSQKRSASGAAGVPEGQLTALDLSHCRVTTDGLLAVLESPRLARLESLVLWDNNIGPYGRRMTLRRTGCDVIL